MSNTDKTTAEKIDAILDTKPTGFVQDFTMSCHARFNVYNTELTPKMAALLDKLYAEVMAPTPAKGAFVGNAGERLTLDVMVLDTRIIDSFYGTTNMVKMMDVAGNVLVTFTKNSMLQANQTVRVKATVKAHKTFAGVNQTSVTRVAVAK